MTDAHILVVDDYTPLAEVAAEVASLALDKPAEACGPLDAVDRLKAGRHSLVILNREMKPTDGPALIGEIKAAGSPARIVMMGTGMDATRAAQLGADTGLATPFNSASLLAALG